jgi:AraC-like DNA-binding protein
VPQFSAIPAHRECVAGKSSLPHHVHALGYAAVVLAGGYDEIGTSGRFRVRPGDVLLHEAFDAHFNRFHAEGAIIANLALPASRIPYRAGRVTDVDAIARAALSEPEAVAELLRTQLYEVPAVVEDWPDLLAEDLLRDPNHCLESWADSHGIAPETVSRGFARLYGTSAARFRAEIRARRALRDIMRTQVPLVQIAIQTGYADQAHMTRAVHALTGAPPSRWRLRSNSFKTAAA